MYQTVRYVGDHLCMPEEIRDPKGVGPRMVKPRETLKSLAVCTPTSRKVQIIIIRKVHLEYNFTNPTTYLIDITQPNLSY